MFILGMILGGITVIVIGVLALIYWEPTSSGRTYNAVVTDQRVASPWGTYHTQYAPTFVEQSLTLSETSPTGYTRTVSWKARGTANAVTAVTNEFYRALSGGFPEAPLGQLPYRTRALPPSPWDSGDSGW